MIKTTIAILTGLILLAGITTAKATTTSSRTITLTNKNFVLLRTEVDDNSIGKLQKGLSSLIALRGNATYPIYIVLDSPGGSIDAGINFIEYAKTFRNVETITLFAASMASAIVEGLPGKRNIIKPGVLMFHRARGGVEGQFEDGELESRINFYKRLVRDMEQTNANRLNITLDSYKNKVKDELWIYGGDAVAQKAADAVVDISCDIGVVNSEVVETFYFMGAAIPVKFNACPLIKSGEVVEAQQRDQYNKYKSARVNSLK